MIPVSRVGDGWLWYLVVLCLPWAGGSAGTSAAIRMFCVGAVDIVLYKIIKGWIARAQPCHACAAIRACVPSLDEFSFPSGHTLHSVACSVILSAYYPAPHMSRRHITHTAPALGQLWCADKDDPGFRRSMSQCTSLLDRAARRSCVEQVMEARRDETAQVTLPAAGGFVGGAASPGDTASLERRAVSRDCVY